MEAVKVSYRYTTHLTNIYQEQNMTTNPIGGRQNSENQTN